MQHKAKKSLGQNFLKSEAALRAIIKAGEIAPQDIILEIGPGKGALTARLLEYSGKVIAVEKDRELSQFLREKFKKEIEEGKLYLVKDDILEFESESYKLKPKSYKLIANIPYNITGAILKKFLTEKNQPEKMVLMVQNEVAKRIVARDKKESILSISVKAYGTPEMIMKVPARYFSPAPKVDSAVIAIKNISRKFFEENKIDEEKFWEIVRAGFAHKRKKLSSNLKKAFSEKPLPSLPLIKGEEQGGGLENARAEDLSLEDWIKIAQKISSIN